MRGLVDGDLGEIWAAQTGQLGIDVGEEPALQQGVVCDVDARDQMAGVEGHLFGLCEVVGGVLVQDHFSKHVNRRDFLGHKFGGVQQVDSLKHLFLVVGKDLDPQFPLRECAGVDGFRQVPPVEVRVNSVGQQGLFPDQRMDPKLWFPVELHQRCRSICGDHPEAVDPETFHHPVGTRDTPVAHEPHGVRLGLGV